MKEIEMSIGNIKHLLGNRRRSDHCRNEKSKTKKNRSIGIGGSSTSKSTSSFSRFRYHDGDDRSSIESPGDDWNWIQCLICHLVILL